jgi:group I intron endonuclease
LTAAFPSAHGIYQIVNLANGKRYVGSAVNLRNRRKEHLSKLRRGIHHSAKLQNAWNKYGEASFQFEVLAIVADKSDLLAFEQRFIDNADCVVNGYNVAPKAGSTLGHKLSEETRRKMRASQLAVPLEIRQARPRVANSMERTAEWRENISRSMTGKKLTPEQRERLSRVAKARSAEAKSKIANAIRQSDLARGGRHSEASKAKISTALAGRKLSESHKQALKEAWARRKLNQ